MQDFWKVGSYGRAFEFCLSYNGHKSSQIQKLIVLLQRRGAKNTMSRDTVCEYVHAGKCKPHQTMGLESAAKVHVY